MAMTAPDIIRISGPEIENFGSIGIVEGFGSAADDRGKVRAAPSCLQKQIVRPSQCEQPALDGVLRVFGFGQVAQALRDDGADGCERILDAVVQLLEDQLLQLVGRLALPGVDAGRGQQTPCIDLGLREQKPQADILCRQIVVVLCCCCLRDAVRFGDRLQTLPIVSS